MGQGSVFPSKLLSALFREKVCLRGQEAKWHCITACLISVEHVLCCWVDQLFSPGWRHNPCWDTTELSTWALQHPRGSFTCHVFCSAPGVFKQHQVTARVHMGWMRSMRDEVHRMERSKPYLRVTLSQRLLLQAVCCLAFHHEFVWVLAHELLNKK